MLKNVPKIVSPALLKILCEMGHSDCICVGDANFPGEHFAKQGGCKIVNASGISAAQLLEAIFALMPADQYVKAPITLMLKAPQDENLDIPIFKEFERIAAKHNSQTQSLISYCERFEFYERAKKCYCIVQSGEEQIYANFIFQKGVIK